MVSSSRKVPIFDLKDFADRSPGDKPISSFLHLDRKSYGKDGWVKKWHGGAGVPSSVLDQPDMYQNRGISQDSLWNMARFVMSVGSRTEASRRKNRGLRRPSIEQRLGPIYEQLEAKNQVTADRPSFPTGVWNPRTRFRFFWDILMLLLTVYTIFIVSFRLAFEATMFRIRVEAGEQSWAFFDSELIYIEYLVDFFFIINFFLQFQTAYFRRKGFGDYEVIVSRKRILFHYLKTWFLFDLLCAVPFEAIRSADLYFNQGINPLEVKDPWIIPIPFTRLPRVFMLFKFPKLFRITRVSGMDRFIANVREQMALRTGLMRVLKFLISFTFSLHLVACLLFFLGTMQDLFKVYRESDPEQWEEWLSIRTPAEQVPGKSWITEVKVVVSRCNGLPVCESGWVRVFDAPITGQYLMSVYWVATTMTQVGYGDLRPFTQYEVISLLLSMLFGSALFSYVVGNATQLIDELQGRTAVVNDRIDCVSRFLVEAGISKNLRSKILIFLSRNLLNPVAVLPSMCEKLPPDLVSEIKLRVFARALYRPDQRRAKRQIFTPILSGLRRDTMAKLIFDMKVCKLRFPLRIQPRMPPSLGKVPARECVICCAYRLEQCILCLVS